MPAVALPGPLTSTDVAEGIRTRGYALAPGTGFDTGWGADAFPRLVRAYEDLEPDAYLADGGAYRFRRHVRFLHRAADGAVLRPEPPGPYFQSAEVNPFAGGSPRWFAPAGPEVRDNPFLHRLLLHGASVFSGLAGAEPGRGLDWEIDVHLVRIRARAEEHGLPSPEGVHRDGFDYIALHLIGRTGVTGGRSIVCDPEGRELERPLLAAPMDSLYADDRRILHGTEPVLVDPAAGRTAGYRDMLLTSYRRTS
ncbi:2OG-Fe dioxygenase family protein [Streptomyces sp. NPDC012888]|uniref:2OG-Fe dioxygenase family protein n=1 Tax=Streptomyces sp. NPDC012888 TaxID=3364855 RepID=UPI0036B73CB0